MATLVGRALWYDRGRGEWKFHCDCIPLEPDEELVVLLKRGRHSETLLSIQGDEPIKVHSSLSWHKYDPVEV